MQLASYRTICEKCGRETITKSLGDVQLRLYVAEQGAPIFVMLCPEHRAALLRILSDFLMDLDPDAG